MFCGVCSGSTSGWAKRKDNRLRKLASLPVLSPAVLSPLPLQFLQHCCLQHHVRFEYRPCFCREPLRPRLTWKCRVGCKDVTATLWSLARTRDTEYLLVLCFGFMPAVGGQRSFKTKAGAAFVPLKSFAECDCSIFLHAGYSIATC